MKEMIGSVLFVILCGFSISMFAYAADTDVVTATVTVQNISVAVTGNNVEYGTLALSGTNSTLPAGSADPQTATNDGNVTEDFNIKGQDSAAWELEDTGAAGSETYGHMFCNDTTLDCATTPTNYTAMNETSYTQIANSIATSGAVLFQLYILAPTATATYTQQSVDVTVQAVLDT